MLGTATLPAVQQALRESGVDGWLLFDFHGCNPIASGFLGLEGMVTRRIFAWIPREGAPTAVAHAIEHGPWRRWPRDWRLTTYSSWRVLEATVRELVAGKRVAMEYSPGDAVPYLDRIPAGVLELVREAGAEVVTSADLVSRFYAVWTLEQLESHRRAAESISTIAREAFAHAGERMKAGETVLEHELQRWILERFDGAGLSTDHGPIVAASENAADPHYAPSADRPRALREGDVVLIDLWAREENGVYADQTWMASVGAPTARAVRVWEAVRDARDAATGLLRDRIAAGEPVRGAEADDAARGVIASRGFAEAFTHRTGHSIDPRSLHGAGPHLDNLETREERLMIPGVGFSVEPGIYIRGEIGVRSEVNGFVKGRELVITPREIQRELIVIEGLRG